MREIIFRGKRVDNGDWVEGYYFQLGSYHYIRSDIHMWEVDPRTVGQFTELTDERGMRIFEGDITQDGDVVMWCYERSGWSLNVVDKGEKVFCHCYSCEGNFEISDVAESIKVVGNIHDKTS